jgi:hypothetical protein
MAGLVRLVPAIHVFGVACQQTLDADFPQAAAGKRGHDDPYPIVCSTGNVSINHVLS